MSVLIYLVLLFVFFLQTFDVNSVRQPVEKTRKVFEKCQLIIKKGNDKDTESLVGTFVLKTVLKFACVERSPA